MEIHCNELGPGDAVSRVATQPNNLHFTHPVILRLAALPVQVHCNPHCPAAASFLNVSTTNPHELWDQSHGKSFIFTD